MTNERPPSFWLRASLAFGWALTFHVAAIVVASVWILVPLLLFPESWPVWTRWLGVTVTLVSGYGMLRSSVWVRDPFRPPSPPLAHGEQERLQRLVREVAATLETPAPAEIFLLPDASAYAVEVRRGLFLRRKRVLLLGVGLLNTCTVTELRAAVAHELAHFIGGDALLAPVLARVRHGLFRVHRDVEGSVLSWPLLLYADTFLRMTQSLSREQERWADRAAVRVAGRGALHRLLERQARADLLYTLLLRSGVSLLLAAGLRPRNLYEGLRRFESSATREQVRDPLESLLRQRATSPYDSHPPLDERLSLLLVDEADDAARAQRAEERRDDRLARELLDEPEALEERVTAQLFEERGHLPLVPIEWDEVAARAVRPALDEGARSAREQVARLFGPERARTDEGALRTLLEVLQRPSAPSPGDDDGLAQTFRAALQPHVAALLSRTLLRRGGRLIVEVGQPFVIRLEEHEYDPEALAEGAVQHPAEAGALREQLKELPPVEPSRPHVRSPPAPTTSAAGEPTETAERSELSDRHREAKGEERATEG